MPAHLPAGGWGRQGCQQARKSSQQPGMSASKEVKSAAAEKRENLLGMDCRPGGTQGRGLLHAH
eukprot:6211272-Pleurochrysis_carterae.AAC.2